MTAPRLQFVPRYDRQMLRDRPDVLFAFGDNLARAGYGGQAGEARDEPNAVGIPTKRSPSMAPGGFLYDHDFPEAKPEIDAGFICLANHVCAGGTVVLPADGLGTGLAQLPTRAPRIYFYIEKCIARLKVLAEMPL